jgi:hypothetical protein
MVQPFHQPTTFEWFVIDNIVGKDKDVTVSVETNKLINLVFFENFWNFEYNTKKYTRNVFFGNQISEKDVTFNGK